MTSEKVSPFVTLSSLPVPLAGCQCVVNNEEILICGGFNTNDCYSYHIQKNEYKLICSYPKDIVLQDHIVVKRENDGTKDITLLSFGGDSKHTLMMRYTSVWNSSQQVNEWIPLNDSENKPIIIGKEKDYIEERALIGGIDNNLLFITYQPNNIDVFNLKTFEYVNSGTLPIAIAYPCFVSKKKETNEMLLFSGMTGLSIEYNEKTNQFTFNELSALGDIDANDSETVPILAYSYVYVNDHILCFGGSDGENAIKVIYKYSIKANKWTQFDSVLPLETWVSVAVLSEDNKWAHILGGRDQEYNILSTHIKTNVEEWINKQGMDIVRIKREKMDENEIMDYGINDNNNNNNNNNNDIPPPPSIDEENDDEKKKEIEPSPALLLINEKRIPITLNELTFGELYRQCYNNLSDEEFDKLSTMKMELVDINDNPVATSKDVKKAFEKEKPTFKTTFLHTGKKKQLKNALVIMIAISDYDPKSDWPSLQNVKAKDIKHFKQLFSEEFKYDFMCNEDKPKMNKQEVDEFFDGAIYKYKLRTNSNQYDGLIVIICGHGDDGNVLVTSEGDSVSIDKIRGLFDCHAMDAFKDFPKIFIIDACRGRNSPNAVPVRGVERVVVATQRYIHNDDGFLTIWSTTKGHTVADSSLLSECMNNVITENYKKGLALNQMLHQIRDKIRASKQGEWYCVESQDTTSYDIVMFANNKTT